MSEQIKWSNAPDRTSWGASMRVADIALDRDHTLTLFCEADQTAKVDAMFAEVKRLREVLSDIVDFVDGPAEGKRPDVFALRIKAARAALKETK